MEFTLLSTKLSWKSPPEVNSEQLRKLIRCFMRCISDQTFSYFLIVLTVWIHQHIFYKYFVQISKGKNDENKEDSIND